MDRWMDGSSQSLQNHVHTIQCCMVLRTGQAKPPLPPKKESPLLPPIRWRKEICTCTLRGRTVAPSECDDSYQEGGGGFCFFVFLETLFPITTGGDWACEASAAAPPGGWGAIFAAAHQPSVSTAAAAARMGVLEWLYWWWWWWW